MLRRHFIKSLIALGALHLAAPYAMGSSKKSTTKSSKAKKKAKSVILVFLAGGPSHTDTFDPKPEAGRSFCGNYLKPIPTNVSGFEINQNLTRLAKIADKYSVIRSMTHKSNAHEIGQYVMYTGDMTGDKIVYPSFGAMISYLNPSDYKGQLPPYISLTKSSTRFNEGGFLGSNYKPLETGGAPESNFFEVEGIINKMVSDKDLKEKQDLLQAIKDNNIQQNSDVQSLKSLQKENFDMLLGEARQVFDLGQEPESVRQEYGMNDFGQSCLAARRLAEYGVPVIAVTYHGWDTHKEHFKRMDQRLGTLDQGLSALISDLDAKGLLDETIVLCGGEFGRTPRVMFEPPWNGGRGHHGAAFSYLVAGGGFKAGQVIGKTDATSENVAERPVYPSDLLASVYQLMGIDPTRKVPHSLLGEVPILASYGKEGQSAGLLKELMS